MFTKTLTWLRPHNNPNFNLTNNLKLTETFNLTWAWSRVAFRSRRRERWTRSVRSRTERTERTCWWVFVCSACVHIKEEEVNVPSWVHDFYRLSYFLTQSRRRPFGKARFWERDCVNLIWCQSPWMHRQGGSTFLRTARPHNNNCELKTRSGTRSSLEIRFKSCSVATWSMRS